MYQLFGIISGLLVILGFVPYIKFIIQNRHTENDGKPVKITWLIWAMNDTIIIIGMYVTKTLNLQISAAVVCAWVLVVLAFLYGSPGWKKIDIFCALGAMLGIFLWFEFDNPTYSIIASNAVLIIGGIPTFISTYQNPERENRFAWTIWFTSCLFALAVIEKWDWNNASQPISFFIIEATEVVLLWIVPRFRMKPILN